MKAVLCTRRVDIARATKNLILYFRLNNFCSLTMALFHNYQQERVDFANLEIFDKFFICGV